MALMLRDSRTASNNFRLNAQHWDGVPKPKFMYYIRFMKSGGRNNNVSSTDWSKGIGMIAKEVDRPGTNFELDTINQYNKKRVVQKKVEYEPLSVTFYDTVDQRAYHLFEDYFRFYYGDPRMSGFSDWTWDIMSQTMHNSGNWGFIAPNVDPEYSYYFSHIELYYIYGGYYSQIDYINPKIESFKPDGLDFSSSEGLEIKLQFKFEGMVYQGNNKSLAGSGLLSEMGLDTSFYQPSSGGSSSSVLPMSSYQENDPGTFYDPASAFYSGGSAAAFPSTEIGRSDALTGLSTSFNSVLNGLLSGTSTSNLLGGNTNALATGNNLANRLASKM